MKEAYFESVVMIERLHRLFLEVIKAELDRMNIRDINNVQALVLYNIGEDQVTVGELTNRGYYLGSNVSYNLRKMVQNKYIAQEPSPHDRRSSHVKLSSKGLDLYQRLDKIFAHHATSLEKDSGDRNHHQVFGTFLKKLETFWMNLMSRDLR
jgi:DNA-binding MarR family transcriptional regulator